MVAILKVVDRHFGTRAPDRHAGVTLRLASERVSARDIIRSRVAAEVDAINRARERRFDDEAAPARSYLIVTEPEERLNAGSSHAWRWLKPVDLEAEADRAISAFSRRRFIMLLDDRQIDDLDEAVGLRPESEVVFVHLTPLKGG